MAKRIVLAVAGAGKTTSILEALSEDRRSLIITYTNENVRSLESSITNKFGHMPKNVTLMSYFSFLYSFCVRPFFSYVLRDKSFTWETPPFSFGAPKKDTLGHYMTKGRYLYANRAAKLVSEFEGVPKIIARIESHFDDLFVDEVQDFAGNDFNLLAEISSANINITLVGDFHQHTFDTSRDGQIRKNLHKKGVEPYLNEFRGLGYKVDTNTLSKTHRCSPTVCDFISKQIGIEILSHRDDETRVEFVEEQDKVDALFGDKAIVKLFYQDSGKYPCNSNNWGKCKGLNSYNDVCVVLNSKTLKHYRAGKLNDLTESTKNKLYVACSRANRNLSFVDETMVRKFRIKEKKI